MYCLKNKYCQLLVVMMMTCSSVMAQMIPISDSNMFDDFCDELPLATNVTCDSIDTVAAVANYSTSPLRFSVSNSGLRNISSLAYFSGIDTLYIPHNKITDADMLPLSTWPNMYRFTITGNELTVAPDISMTPNIQFIYAISNEIDTFSSGWYVPHNTIQVIDLRYNDLENIPAFETYPEIRRLNLRYNKLTFEDLIPIKGNPRWGTSIWELFPQQEFFLHNDVTKKIGEDISITINDGSPTNTYYFYKDSVLLDSNVTGIYNINDLEKDDEGVYYAEIRNSEFTQTDAVMTSEPFTLLISDPVDVKDVHVFSPNGDGVADFFLIEGTGSFEIVNKGGQSLQMGSLPYSWYGDDKSGANVEPGLYFVKTDTGYLKVLVTY